MEKNIFENAYFGKAYKTRDGKKAVLISLSNFSALLSMELDMSGISSVTIPCGLDGKIRDKFLSSDQDIVSEWEEDIDEEHLDDLAYDYNEERQPNYWWEDDCTVCVCEASEVRKAFEAGYKVAKKGK